MPRSFWDYLGLFRGQRLQHENCVPRVKQMCSRTLKSRVLCIELWQRNTGQSFYDKSDEYILHIIPQGLFNSALDKRTKGIFHGCSLLHSTANNNMQLIKKIQYQDTTQQWALNDLAHRLTDSFRQNGGILLLQETNSINVTAAIESLIGQCLNVSWTVGPKR